MHFAADWIGPLIVLVVVLSQAIGSALKGKAAKEEKGPVAPQSGPQRKGSLEDALSEALGKRKGHAWNPPPVPAPARPVTRVTKPRSFPVQLQPVPATATAVFTALESVGQKSAGQKTAAVAVASTPALPGQHPRNARLDEIVKRLSDRGEARWLFLCQEIFRKSPAWYGGPFSSID